METSILKTKLYVPPPRPDWVARPRLVERLDERLRPGHKLTLLSAPAGFGKTTLLSEWIAQSDEAIAWLSLDQEDNAPERFWTYFIAALQDVRPALGQSILPMLRVSPLPPLKSLLTTLINEIAEVSNRLTVVLDDYHLITTPSIHEGLGFLLEYMPYQLHLVIASRSDPPLPLHLWRGRQQLTELHAADLRFTPDEAAALLNETMELDLAAEHVDALERRTEGWITGLQLAALSMAGQDDVSGFVEAFAGSHRYVLDYLVEEVLHRQPQAVQTFMLQTSILDRLTAPLCEAVTGQGDGRETLRTLERVNLFVVPLDDQRRWYRYHHLFAEVLRAFLQRTTAAEERAQLHQRAAAWYLDQGQVGQAFKHAMAARDFEQAAQLIERNWLQMGNAGKMNTLLGWLASMPEDIVRARPLLSLAYAWALWLTGQIAAAAPHLDAADEGWERQAAAGVDDPNRPRWQAGGVALRIQLARYQGRLGQALQFSRQTLALAPPDDALLRSYGHLGLAHSYRELGDYQQSAAAYVEGLALTRVAGNIAAANIAAFYLYRVRQIQGRLREAAEVVQEALQFTDAQGMGESPACGILHVALADLLCERHELSEAEAHLLQGLDMSRLGGHHDFLRNAGIVLARLRLAQGNPPDALAAIEEAEQTMPATEMLLAVAELAAYKARVWIAQGNLPAAVRWAEQVDDRPGQDRGYTRQIEAVARARVLVAQGELVQALDQLAVCQRMAKESGGRGWAVEIGILRALVQDALGQRTDALVDLGHALGQAEPEGYVQVFVGEGAPIAALLTAYLRTLREDARSDLPDVSRAYVRQLLDTLGRATEAQASAHPAEPAPLVEPLTARETEVLQLMAAGLSNRQIAEELTVAIGTVKAHLHNIYGKLDAPGRMQAAARARELGLL